MAMCKALLATLAARIGRQQANNEFRWMKEATHLDLPTMLTRRIQGEPLQYILGMSSIIIKGAIL